MWQILTAWATEALVTTESKILVAAPGLWLMDHPRAQPGLFVGRRIVAPSGILPCSPSQDFQGCVGLLLFVFSPFLSFITSGTCLQSFSHLCLNKSFPGGTNLFQMYVGQVVYLLSQDSSTGSQLLDNIVNLHFLVALFELGWCC